MKTYAAKYFKIYNGERRQAWLYLAFGENETDAMKMANNMIKGYSWAEGCKIEIVLEEI